MTAPFCTSGAQTVYSATTTATSWIWNTPANWAVLSGPGTTYPTAPGDTADILVNIAASTTVTLTSSATIGVLNLGDTNFSNSYFLTGTNGATLTFDNTPNGADAMINITGQSLQNFIGTSGSATSLAVLLNGALDINNYAPIGNNGSGSIIYSNISSAATSGTQTLTVNLYALGGAVGLGSAAGNGTISDGGSGGKIGLTVNGNATAESVTIGVSGTANSYTGVTVVNNATLSMTSGVLANGGTASSIGASSNAASNLVLNGGTLSIGNAAVVSTDRLFTIGAGGAALVAASSNAVTFSNTGALAFSTSGNTTLTLLGNAAYYTGTFAPQLTDNLNGGTLELVKAGSGVWTITGTNNTYSGGTLISGGRLLSTGSLAFGTGGITVSGTGILEETSGTQFANSVNLVTAGTSAPILQIDSGSIVPQAFTVRRYLQQLDSAIRGGHGNDESEHGRHRKRLRVFRSCGI